MNPSRSFVPSPQQLAVFDWVRSGSGSLNLISYAGTGKTTTLMEIAKIIKGSAFCGAFNKAIADEFSERLRLQGSFHVKGATIHSAGLAAWKRVAQGCEIDGQKVRQIAKTSTPQAAWNKKLVGVICDAVSYAKQLCLGVQGQISFSEVKPWDDLIDHYDLRDEIPGGMPTENFIQVCIKVYRESLNLCEQVIDFDDMLLAPLYHQAAFKKYDWVMIDEAQDTNTARRLIAYAMMHSRTRLVAVGDPHQAIYGFAGASSNAMDIIKADLGSSELPLSVTYRCPNAVVNLAKLWVPGFEAHETAPEGSVHTISHRELWKVGKPESEFRRFTSDDVILCRNTRPLVGIAGRLREMDIPCVVEGAGAKGLIALATKWGDDIEIDQFLEFLEAYQTREVAKHKEKGNEEKAESVVDRCDTLRDICKYKTVHTTNHLAQKIDFLFGDTNKNVLRLCTVHRSKGREWERVFLIGRNRYMPSPYATKDWQQEQENNLMYVAVTRAKEMLVEVRVPFKRRDGTEWWEEGFVNAAENGEREVYRDDDGGAADEPAPFYDWTDTPEDQEAISRAGGEGEPF